MKTLFVGDIHLKAPVILPIVKQQIAKHNIGQIVFTGDYLDLTRKRNDAQLFRENLRQLIEFKKAMQAEGIKVINLIGNHDVAYICDKPLSYSCSDNNLFTEVGDLLMELGFQVACQVDGYLVSHAGYTLYIEPKSWQFEKFSVKYYDFLYKLDDIIGHSRGGLHEFGGPLWADLNLDLLEFYNPHFKKQIVGHSHVRTININNKIIGIDTFDIYPQGDNWSDLGYHSDGSMLMLDEGVPIRIETDYTKPETKEKLINLLHKGIY